ncbi:MAG: LPS export ABC transporter periplasmic protein LptC [Balneolaceae bacterium]
MRTSFRDWVTPETGILAQPNSFLLCAFLLSFSACSELSEFDNQQVESALNDSLVSTTESWDVEMMLMKDGRSRILIDGSYAVSYQSEERKQTNIDGPVYVQLFDSTGAVETEAWSKRAIYYDAKREFELYDSVKVETVTQRELYTEFLKWSQDSDRISTPDFVTIITPADSIAGYGFDGLTDLSSYTIQEPRGRVIVD